MHLHLGGPILVPKDVEEIDPADVQVEEIDGGGLDMFLGVDQALEVDE